MGFLLPPFLSLEKKKKGIFLLKYSVERLLLKPCTLWGQADCPGLLAGRGDTWLGHMGPEDALCPVGSLDARASSWAWAGGSWADGLARG